MADGRSVDWWSNAYLKTGAMRTLGLRFPANSMSTVNRATSLRGEISKTAFIYNKFHQNLISIYVLRQINRKCFFSCARDFNWRSLCARST